MMEIPILDTVMPFRPRRICLSKCSTSAACFANFSFLFFSSFWGGHDGKLVCLIYLAQLPLVILFRAPISMFWIVSFSCGSITIELDLQMRFLVFSSSWGGHDGNGCLA